MPYEHPVIAVILGAGFIGGLVRGYSGFGFAMAAVPILSLGLHTALAVPTVLLHELAIGLFSLRAERGNARAPMLVPLGLGSVVGTPLGIAILSSTPDQHMRVGVALSLLLSVLALWRVKGHIALGHGVLCLTGFASGILNGATAMSGPPAVIVLLGCALPAAQIRAQLIRFIVFSAAIGVGLTFAGGLQGRASLTAALVMTPGVLTGALAGALAFRHLPHRHYRKISMIGVLVIASGSLLAAVNINEGVSG